MIMTGDMDVVDCIISVVICTYNRSDLLGICLDSLVRQSAPTEKFEIIVVDNNSTDNTQELVSDFADKFGNVRCVTEKKQGLSSARNRGWREAVGQYVAYADDDCKMPDTWIVTALDIIDRVHPALFGGPFYPFYNYTKPAWYKDKYGSHDLGNKERILEDGKFIFGGNIFFKKHILASLGGFLEDLGMKGDEIAYGEEVELQRKFYTFFPEETAFYAPRLYVYHLVRREKTKWRWIIKYRFVTRRYAYRVLPPEEKKRITGFFFLQRVAGLLVHTVFSLVFGLLRRDKEKYPFYQNYLYEYVLLNVDRLGWMYERYTT